MYGFLTEFANLSTEGVDMVLHILGDKPQTYIKILNAETEYKTFDQLVSDYEKYTEDCV